MVFQTEKAMEEAGDKIDASEKAAVQEKIDALKAVVDRTANQADISDADIDALKSGKEDLMNAAQKLFQKMYEQTQHSMPKHYFRNFFTLFDIPL